MATLILSTVGSALGGPVGGAIGALIGQSIDQQLLGPATRGPRLGDLSVQTSTYGTQVPRIYGTLRVAGTVIWATDLAESSQTTGAKGQPDATYSYSVSLAVAVSSRPVAAIKRIWADGKLLRGADGDFKVSTTFRFYNGGEDQQIDPLIGSAEGIANTPAYRGLALAVFENLELADYGNRIPFLTFEIAADDEPPSIATVLADASNSFVASDAGQQIAGYAAYGPSIKAAIEPLISQYGIDLFDDGSELRSAPNNSLETVADEDFGNSADNEKISRLQREQTPSRALPASLRLRYYDPGRDYQMGEARARVSEQPGNEVQLEIPVALNADEAKSLAQQILAREWAKRDKLTLSLPPRFLGLEPGAKIALSLNPGRWSVEQCTIERFAVRAELRPSWSASPTLAAEAGRIVSNTDVVAGQLSLALLDIPNVLQQPASKPTLLLAASSPTSGWKRQRVDVRFAGQEIVARTPLRKSVLGNVLTVLAPGEPHLIDTRNSIDIELIDAEQWLISCDDDALAAGSNVAVIGRELVQFGVATPIGVGRFRLSRLLRGRGGTEWASSTHSIDDLFCLIGAATLEPLALPAWSVGADIVAEVPDGPRASLILSAESARPPAPVDLTAAIQSSGDLILGWTRRSRDGFAWIDEVDAPLSERIEQYRVAIAGLAASDEFMADAPSLTVAATTVGSLGSGPATIEVRQIGDLAASFPAQLSVILP